MLDIAVAEFGSGPDDRYIARAALVAHVEVVHRDWRSTLDGRQLRTDRLPVFEHQRPVPLTLPSQGVGLAAQRADGEKVLAHRGQRIFEDFF